MWHGWGPLIGSRGPSRVFFVVYSLKQILILEVFFFVCNGSITHGIGVKCLDKAISVGGMFSFLIMLPGPTFAQGRGMPLMPFFQCM